MLKLDLHRYKSIQDEYNRECTEDGEYFDGAIWYLNPDNINLELALKSSVTINDISFDSI